MKFGKLVLMLAVSGFLVVGIAYAAGDVAKGKALFKKTDLGGGIRSCDSCHPDGSGLERAGEKKKFKIYGKTQKSLEEAVNFCIVGANKGKAIDAKGDDMADIVAYIKSLKAPATGKKGY